MWLLEPIQATVYPPMAYYLKGETMVKHAIIGISSDRTHDAHFVKEFEERTLNLVTEQSTAAIKIIFEWTDGCAAQYKGKTGFADIFLSKV